MIEETFIRHISMRILAAVQPHKAAVGIEDKSKIHQSKTTPRLTKLPLPPESELRKCRN